MNSLETSTLSRRTASQGFHVDFFVSASTILVDHSTESGSKPRALAKWDDPTAPLSFGALRFGINYNLLTTLYDQMIIF